MDNVTSKFFSEAFAKFLFSPNGAKFQNYIHFNDSLECDGNASAIKVKYKWLKRTLKMK